MTTPNREQNWISVKDRLPECDVQHRHDYESGYVLTWDGGEYEILSYWKLANGKEGWSADTQGITHWMPLPNPPSRESKPVAHE